MVVLHGFMIKMELQDIQTRDHLSLFISGTEGSHLTLRGDLLSVMSSTKRLALKTFGSSSRLFLCLRLEVYDYHRLIGFLERLERREKGEQVSTISVSHNQRLKG